MDSYKRFQEKNRKRTAANKDLNEMFVFNANNSVSLDEIDSSIDTPHTVPASVVNKQEKDLAYIYTRLEDELKIGTVWGAKTLKWLIVEEIITMKDVKWHKYLALLCNINIENSWGYFITPESKFVNVELNQKFLVQSLEHPVLVLAKDTLNINDKIVVGGRAWLVQEKDNIAQEGIDYYSLRETTISKGEDESGKPVPKEDGSKEEASKLTPEFNDEITYKDGIYYIPHNYEITLTTEEGYFRISNPSVKIKRQTEQSAIFEVPFGIDSEFTVKVKLNNEVIESRYKAVK